MRADTARAESLSAGRTKESTHTGVRGADDAQREHRVAVGDRELELARAAVARGAREQRARAAPLVVGDVALELREDLWFVSERR